MTKFHLGHVPGTVLVDKTELDELRAENERLRVALTESHQVCRELMASLEGALRDALGNDKAR